MALFAAEDPIGTPFRGAVGDALRSFITGQSERLAGIGERAELLSELALAFTAGGKRLRPAFCWWGYQAVEETTDLDALLRAAASLDLLHVSALMHDDVMDASDVRRGLPAAHRQFETWHSEHGLTGSAEAFGRAGAILLGDLLLVWSMELFTASGLPGEALGRGLPLLDAMRTEVTCGQFLDVVAQAEPIAGVDLMDVVPRVVEFKTSRYTMIRPLQLGAALAGGSPETLDALGRYGSAVGRAFQLRAPATGSVRLSMGVRPSTCRSSSIACSPSPATLSGTAARTRDKVLRCVVRQTCSRRRSPRRGLLPPGWFTSRPPRKIGARLSGADPGPPAQ